MPRTALASREDFINAATRLFWEKGYGATSIADVLHATGTNAGSLYYLFPTKQHLLVAVLRRYRDAIQPMLLDPAWKAVDDPIERIFALLAVYRKLLVSTDCFYGCPIGSLALELHEPDPVVRKLLAANFDAWTGAIERCLGDAGGRIPKKVNPAKLASFVLSVMEGGVMQARTHRTIVTFDAAVQHLRDHFALIEGIGPPPNGRRKNQLRQRSNR